MKKNIILGVILLIIFIILVVIKGNDNTIEGRVVDIYDNNLLIHINGEPYNINFKNNISGISLNDIVKIRTDGIVRESYPMQITGLSVKKIKNDYKKMNDVTTSTLFDTTYYEETLTYKNKFKTVVFKTKDEFKNYVNKSKILLQENIDDIYKDSFAVVSTTSMSSGEIISFEGIYLNNNNISINLNVTTSEVTTTDIMTKGNIIILNKKYIDFNFETVSKTIIKR